MFKRHDVQHGTLLRLLKPLGRVAYGTVGQVEMIREEQHGYAWGFSVCWHDSKLKNRHSLYFGEAELEYFELLAEHNRRDEPCSIPQQLTLPYTTWLLYRGTDIVHGFETWL